MIDEPSQFQYKIFVINFQLKYYILFELNHHHCSYYGQTQKYFFHSCRKIAILGACDANILTKMFIQNGKYL